MAASIRKWDLLPILKDYASDGYADDSPRSSFLLDLAIHCIDLVSYLFGDARQVCSFGCGADAYPVSIRFDGGAVGSLSPACGRSFSVPTEEVETAARNGNFMTIQHSSSWRIAERGKPMEWREPPAFVSGGDSGNDAGHWAEIVDFLAAIREKGSTRSTICESH